MDTSVNWLKFIIFTLIGLLFIGVVVFFYNVADGSTKQTQEMAVSQVGALSDAEFNMYQDTSVTGADVLEAVRRYKTRPSFNIRIITGLVATPGFIAETGNGTAICWNGPSTGGTATSTASACSGTITLATMMNSASVNYVNKTARFQSKVLRDGNAEVRLLYFIQK